MTQKIFDKKLEKLDFGNKIHCTHQGITKWLIGTRLTKEFSRFPTFQQMTQQLPDAAIMSSGKSSPTPEKICTGVLTEYQYYDIEQHFYGNVWEDLEDGLMTQLQAVGSLDMKLMSKVWPGKENFHHLFKTTDGSDFILMSPTQRASHISQTVVNKFELTSNLEKLINYQMTMDRLAKQDEALAKTKSTRADMTAKFQHLPQVLPLVV
jgi:hypothetical protein